MSKNKVIEICGKEEKQTFLQSIETDVLDVVDENEKESCEQVQEIRKRILYKYFDSYLEAGFNTDYFSVKLEQDLAELISLPRGMVKYIVRRCAKKFNK